MAEFNAVVQSMVSWVVTLWKFFVDSLGFLFWLIVVAYGVAPRILRLIHKVFDPSS